MGQLTPKVFERLNSKHWRMNHLYKIVNKNRDLVQMRFNPEQEKLYRAYANKKSAQPGLLREMILKNRQVGFSTFHLIWMLDDCIFLKNQNACLIAHEQEALEKLFRIVKTAWENMPEELRPKATLENIRELHFPHSNSTIFIALKARSGTLSHLHVSEYAKIKDVIELKSGSFQAAGAGDITVEFTGNGLNHAYTDWNENSAWSKHFFPWTEHEEYTLKDWAGLRNHEEYLNKLKVTEEQKNWWYAKLDELGDIGLLKQEYPAEDDEAFITSSRGVFSDVLETPESTPISSLNEPHLVLDIYEEPGKEEQYVIGADPSGGFADGDFSCFYIINSRTRKIALEWHGHIAPDLFGLEIKKYADKYNQAFIGIEVNNHGLSTINAIKDLGVDLYQRERRDRVTNEITTELGWQTTAQSKDELLDEIRTNLRDGSVKTIPKGLKRELQTFVRKENGRCEAEEGCHDDKVVALGIGLMMVKASPYWVIKTKKNKFMGR